MRISDRFTQSYPPPRKNHHSYNNGYNNNQRGGFRGHGRGGRFQNQGHHAPPPVGQYSQDNFVGNNGGFRPQRPKQQFPASSNGPAFTPHPQNNGPFNTPQAPVQRRNSVFAPNPTPAFIPNPNYVPEEDMVYGAQQAPPPQMNFNGPPTHGLKRPYQPDVQQYGGGEYMQQPPAPPRPNWQQGSHVQANFGQRAPQPRRQMPQPHQQPRLPLTSRIGI
ncbi:hypothetical protein PENSPDRAFT_328977 [Peniophora sp. CONT]|nr:hypothetical protein PENSPDRAFT_328977 [Peniophora sp. CONT]